MRPVAMCLLMLLMVAEGCALNTQRGSISRDRNLITLEELETHARQSAFEAVRFLRPGWLQPVRGGRSSAPNANYPYVFLDGVPFGRINILNSIDVSVLSEIRFVSASDATTRWGTGYQSGVIALRTKGLGQPDSPISRQ